MINKKKMDIIIVDDHLIFRQELKAIINFKEIGSVIAETSNGKEFIELLTTLKTGFSIDGYRYARNEWICSYN